MAEDLKTLLGAASSGGAQAPITAAATAGTSAGYTQANFPAQAYIDSHPGLGKGNNKYGPEDIARAYADYQKNNGSWQAPGTTPAQTPEQAAAAQAGVGSTTQIVPGAAQNGSQSNVVDAASTLVNDPSKIISGDQSLVEQNKNTMTGTEAGTNVNGADPKYDKTTGGLPTAAQGTAQTANPVDPRAAQTYDPKQTQTDVANADMSGVNGTVSQNAQINAPQIDTKAIADATDANGVGKALTEYATQDLNTVDKKATVKGQLEMLQEDFVDPNTGEPKIPVWAQETARSVGRITAFTGASGSAATASMAQAIMEASIPVATEDAKFFQTLTLQNLSNKQASTINRANVLSNMELANQDARMTAAVENSKAFLQMDLANLSNDQQAAVINNQNRVNSILEDAKAVNTQRMFTAQSQNEKDMFYDNLNSQISQFNTSQVNGMSQFNTDQTNSMSKFNADLENNRDQFYKTMQYNIDVSNAKWRQTVTLQEDSQAFEAAATDVKNMVGLSTEQLNQIWDRSDSLLQYYWQSGENEADRKANMAIAKFQASAAQKGAVTKGIGEVAGAIAGAGASKIFDKLF